MSLFKLPDLGEGLPDAEIREWLVKEGDEVMVDQPVVSLETAKAVVEVPSPQHGKIQKLHGKTGDVIATGSVLIEFADSDVGTVVGTLEAKDELVAETAIIALHVPHHHGIKATPAVRALAQQLHVDLGTIVGTGPQHTITAEDVRHTQQPTSGLSQGEPLKGLRRQMAQAMIQSHASVVPVTIMDDADIHAWPANTDVTVRIIRAIVKACQQVPALNAWFDGQQLSRQLLSTINLGLAVDSEEGLMVPVIHDAAQYIGKSTALRAKIDELKAGAKSRTIAPKDLQGASITLSNFGTFAGRYANPIVVPPQVAIVGIGRSRDSVVAVQEQVVIHHQLPLSLTLDHRAVTGGEAAKFLAMMIEDLQQRD